MRGGIELLISFEPLKGLRWVSSSLQATNYECNTLGTLPAFVANLKSKRVEKSKLSLALRNTKIQIMLLELSSPVHSVFDRKNLPINMTVDLIRPSGRAHHPLTCDLLQIENAICIFFQRLPRNVDWRSWWLWWRPNQSGLWSWIECGLSKLFCSMVLSMIMCVA